MYPNTLLCLLLPMVLAKDAYQLSLNSPQNNKYPPNQAIPITLDISEISDVAAVGFSASYTITSNGNTVASSSTSLQLSSSNLAQPYSWSDSFTPGSTGSYDFRMEFQTKCSSTKQVLTASFTVEKDAPVPSTTTPTMKVSVPSDSKWEACLKNAGQGSQSLSMSASTASSGGSNAGVTSNSGASSNNGPQPKKASGQTRVYSSSSISIVGGAVVVGAGLMDL